MRKIKSTISLVLALILACAAALPISAAGPLAGDSLYINTHIDAINSATGKNYLSDTEIGQLNSITTSFLDFAETRAQRHIITTMEDWRKRLDQFLTAMNYDANASAGTVSHEEAKAKAYREYEKYKIIQDRSYISDFDRFNKDDDDAPLLPFNLNPEEK